MLWFLSKYIRPKSDNPKLIFINLIILSKNTIRAATVPMAMVSIVEQRKVMAP